MRHLDLFSGIGGFALAASWGWGDEHKIHSFVEIDPFCQKVLKKHWPDVPIHPDIKDYKHDGTAINIISGGPPCTHTSVASAIQGSRTGETLYPYMGRIISLVEPEWCIIEQPSGNKKWEDQVAKHLAKIGYSVAVLERQASDIGSPHRRRRVFIIANTNSERLHKIARLRGTRTVEQKPWPTPPRGAWRSTRAGACRVDDGIPNWMDRIKSLGNAIVPQVVVPIMQAIKEIEGGG